LCTEITPPSVMTVVLCTDAMTALRWFFTRLSGRVATAHSPLLEPPHLPAA
jgi:hypothetical protein